MVTMKDVAARAGVSVTTVSHVLNKTRFVTPEVSQRVMTAISELSYAPDPVARGLRSRRTNLIALVIPDINNPFFPELARGAQDVADDHNYVAILCNTDRKGTRERRFLETLRRQRVEGLILNPAEVTAGELLTLQAGGVEIVLLGQQISHPAFDVVMIDNVQGAHDMVSYLIKCGHKRIAHLGGLRSASSGRLRYEGYLRALEEHGLAADPALISEGAFTKQEGHAAMHRLLAVRPLPTAIFAVNDLVAVGALMALKEAGVRVPQDVAIAGFDNIDEAACIEPALTTINQPKYEMGKAAAELLFRCLESGKTPRQCQHIILSHELVARASTG